ncbi:TrkH-domain-containing protein [Fomitiporia mediterranea MF3/22]|uniref:TrkH-domain-containing protein n=1 Tax=Fomitiporia mediterranea (strain MF3/22) TaxID=694068 RepID=UPI0004407468|nr:TrkH-domain-containing protein [Fomitiporia mediterranea MF3/22]EJD08024.1 TrkH-domain-containing protein [Fomitiporia mediterranea MF3/22]
MNLGKLAKYIARNLNFFRIHVLFFIFTPLIFAAIFYAANGATHVAFIDALFACVSAICCCGLITVDLSSLTGFQQAILFFLASVGNPVIVSWVIVYIRRRYFNKKLKNIVEAEITKRKQLTGHSEEGKDWLLRGISRVFSRHPTRQSANESTLNRKFTKENESEAKQSGHSSQSRIIRRTSDAPRRVDPNGLISDPVPVPNLAPHSTASSSLLRQAVTHGEDPSVLSETTLDKPQAVDFREPVRVPERQGSGAIHRTSSIIVHDDRTYIPPGGVPLQRRASTFPTQTLRSIHAGDTIHAQSEQSYPETRNSGFGGFPYPTTLLYQLLKKAFPSVRRAFSRASAAIARKLHIILSGSTARGSEKGVKRSTAKYFSASFNALIGRNSMFYNLTEEDLEELGGVEYRGLNALLWLIATYHFGVHLLCFTIIAPYMAIPRWAPILEPPNQHRKINPVWYSAFQVVGAYSTTGMSLVDQSMVPFQEAYPLIFVCTFLILAGNLAYPVFLRFYIWFIMKVSTRTSLNETLQFLLDHPRRCYIYLFPSPHTWLLWGVVIFLIIVDWFFFLVLNIGEAVYDAIPLGVRFAIGILQSTSVRAAGFATVATSSFAPALQVLYVMVMYLAIYPITLSVRATNVYEEKSLGIFEDQEDYHAEEPTVEQATFASYGKFIVWHTRRQLAFDMWWLGVALFLCCIVERGKIQNQGNFQWFTIFALIFEMMSAYAGVGMSLGVPYDSFSFSGALTSLSKFIIIIVMIRGRHRYLPVAIDRAVLLPHEFKKVTPSAGLVEHDGDRVAEDADRDAISESNRLVHTNKGAVEKDGS